MAFAFFTPRRTAGVFLVGSFAVLLAAATIMIISGAFAGFPSMIQDHPADAAQYASVFHLLIEMFVISWILQLLGAGLLCHLEAKAGEAPLAVIAFLLMLSAVWTAIFTYTFRMSVELLVAGQLAQGSELPPLYASLREWTREVFGMGYYLYVLGVIGIGWGGLRCGVLNRGLGWAAVGLAILTLLGRLVDVGAPAVPLLAPVLIGIDLLRDRGTQDELLGRQALTGKA